MKRAILFAVIAVFAIAVSFPGGSPAKAPTFAVAPYGDDRNAGTAKRPWRTIQRAADGATPGSTVDIRAGVYRERVAVHVSGTPGRPIRFRAHAGERAVLDGAGLPPGEDVAALIELDSVHDLIVEGLELRGQHDPDDAFVPAGVFVTGSAHDIVLRGLDVHDIRTRAGDAHGIAVYGTSASSPIHDVLIAGNRVHDLRLGSSESVVVNGNVRDWKIIDNHIFRNDNIAIDAIGFEGTAPANDRARHGIIAHNRIEDIDSLGNPAYDEEGGGNCRCADGIYIDGGTRILIERNTILRTNIGLELASEHAEGDTSDVLARDNLIAQSTTIGLALGGYDRERGPTFDAHVINNTFYNNDTLHSGSGEVLLQFRVSDSEIINNVFVANDQAQLIANPYTENTNNTVDYNAWWVDGAPPTKARWEWKTTTYTSFAAYRAGTHNDTHGLFADPRLHNGIPRARSPLIDAGFTDVAAGPLDLFGGSRRLGAAIDIGAIETR